MFLASSYPMLDVFLSILWFALFFLWIWILITVIVDLFASRDLSGIAKALWFIVIIFLPVLGVLFYLLIRGHKMQTRAAAVAAAREQSQQAYIRQVATGEAPSTADELQKLANLRDAGLLSNEEFEREKSQLLASG